MATPSPSLISSFLAVGRRSWSLKAGLRGPISAELILPVILAGEAPVRRWTTARKVEGSAWTKVVLGREFGSNPFWNTGGNDGFGLEEEDAMGEARRVVREKGKREERHKMGLLLCCAFFLFFSFWKSKFNWNFLFYLFIFS